MLSFLERFLQVTNETLSAIIVIVAASMLLYNLSRNQHSRVVRASSVLLACVTIVSLIDVFISLNPSQLSLRNWLRAQWVGIAFAPAAMFHLSDALLATTGLVSRGRRRRIVRLLYLLSATFAVMALTTDLLVYGLVQSPAPYPRAGPMFPVYVLYFLTAIVVSVYNVLRARRRCLTTYTYRRMSYLLYSFTMPAIGIFPYSLLLADASASPLLFWLLVNLNNLGIALMLLFIAYPLSFFGSNIPDRVIKAELLRFFLRGPFAGILVLVIVLYLPRAGRILGLPGDEFMLFAAVAMVMFWQWMVSLYLPRLERYLVYPDEQAQVQMLQDVSQRLLTHNDLHQLFEALLAAVCDLLQVPVAFLATLDDGQMRITASIGGWQPDEYANDGGDLLKQMRANNNGSAAVYYWHDFWVVPLYSARYAQGGANGNAQAGRLLGILGVQARAPEVDLTADEQRVFDTLVRQTSQALDDQVLQTEIFTALEKLLPEMEAIQRLRDTARYGDFPALMMAEARTKTEVEPGFVSAVRDALRDYWGGPRLTQSDLLQLSVVQAALEDNDNNPTRALRAVLQEAVSRMRPAGERSMTQAEWTLYNIVELRFIQGHRVRDVAKRLAMSEADLYRKQRAAIEEVARILIEMEKEAETVQ